MAKSPKSKPNGKVTWAQMVRDVLITAINRGQRPILGLLFIVCIIVWRIPATSLSDMANSILTSLKAGEMWAYGLLTITASGWFLHSNYMRKMFSQEMLRVGSEKSKLQNSAANKNFKSSR